MYAWLYILLMVYVDYTQPTDCFAGTRNDLLNSLTSQIQKPDWLNS